MHLKKILGYALGPIGGGILSLISLPLITWFYSVEDVGRISMLQVFTNFAVLLFGLGLDQAYVREYHETHNKALLLKTLIFPCIFFSLFSVFLILIYNSNILSIWLYGIASTYLSVITIICFVAALLTRFLSLVLRMQGRAFAFSISQLLPKLLLLIFIIGVFVLGGPRDTFSLLSINMLSIVSAFVFYAFNTRKDWLNSIQERIDKEQLKKYFFFGFPLLIGALASWALNMADRLFLRQFSNYHELGVYSVAMSLAGTVTIIATIFNTIWAPVVYKWVSEGNVDYNKIDEIAEYLLMIIFFLAVLSGLFSWIIPFFLPSQYLTVQSLIVACVIGPLFYTLSETTAIGIAIVRKTSLLMVASIIAMLVNILGNYFLVPILGSSGSAIAFATSFWIFFVVRTEFSKLVWRNIPTFRTYLITFIILILSILNIFNFKDLIPNFLIWLFMFFIGLMIFRKRILKVLTLGIIKRINI